MGPTTSRKGLKWGVLQCNLHSVCFRSLLPICCPKWHPLSQVLSPIETSLMFRTTYCSGFLAIFNDVAVLKTLLVDILGTFFFGVTVPFLSFWVKYAYITSSEWWLRVVAYPIVIACYHCPSLLVSASWYFLAFRLQAHWDGGIFVQGLTQRAPTWLQPIGITSTWRLNYSSNNNSYS